MMGWWEAGGNEQWTEYGCYDFRGTMLLRQGLHFDALVFVGWAY